MMLIVDGLELWAKTIFNRVVERVWYDDVAAHFAVVSIEGILWVVW